MARALYATSLFLGVLLFPTYLILRVFFRLIGPEDLDPAIIMGVFLLFVSGSCLAGLAELAGSEENVREVSSDES